MLINVSHETIFDYTEDVSSSVMEVRLRPANHERQVVRRSTIDVTPHTRLFAHADYFGNVVHFFTVPVRHRRLAVISRSEVQTMSNTPETTERPLWGQLWEYLQFSPPVSRRPELADIATGLTSGTLLDELQALNHYIHEQFEYRPRSTDVDSTLADVLASGSGVCQDFAHLMIGVCREMKVPARYVSGYVVTNHAPGFRGQDASHAWCQCFVPERGWVAFDPTNDRLVDERYVEVGIGRDYHDVPPTKGIYRGSASESMSVAVHTQVQDQGEAAA